MKKRLFALFAGINEYERTDGFRTLNGAEADAKNLAAYLREMGADIDVQPEILLGPAATRERITDGILTHLGQAGSEDVALFFFSGHGLREEAPLAFQETSRTVAMESLACYDSYGKPGVFGLASKELRYLLHKAAPRKPHLVVITDCCHSAAATRSGMMPVRRNAEPWRYAMLPARKWEHFAFAQEIASDRPLTAQELEEKLPQAQHLHLAACQAEQSAFEIGEEGIFTSHLLEVLRQSSGAVSYFQLRERVASLIRSRSRQYDQTPNIYQPRGSFLAEEAFLGLQQRKSKIFVAVTVGETDIRINRGLIHGIPTEDDQQGIEISVFEKDHAEVGEVVGAQVWKTGISSSEIRLVGAASLKTDRLYEAHIQGLFQRDFNAALWGADTEEAGKQLIREAFRNGFQKEIAEQPGPTTDCVVVLRNNRITLAHPDSDFPSLDEKKYLPLTRQINGYSRESAAQVVRFLQHIAKFEVTRSIANRNSSLKGEDIPLEIGIGKGDYPTRFAEWNETAGCFDIRLGEPGMGPQEANLFFTITNKAQTQLYVCLAYMSQRFGVYPDMLDPAAMSLSLDPGKSFKERKLFTLESFIVDFNQPYEKGLFRLFAATEAFSLEGLELEDLPPPELGADKGNDRGVLAGIKAKPKKTDWIVVDYPARIINTAYRKSD